jgi:hypothetical protein
MQSGPALLSAKASSTTAFGDTPAAASAADKKAPGGSAAQPDGSPMVLNASADPYATASSLPHTPLSLELEKRVRARMREINPAASDSLVVRMVSSLKKSLSVPQEVRSVFQAKPPTPFNLVSTVASTQALAATAVESVALTESTDPSSPSAATSAPSQYAPGVVASEYADNYTYRQRVILLWQRLDNVDVCLFALYVQEYGADCPAPNTRRVYIAYLDSVKYLRPLTSRTAIYHELLSAYLANARNRGFDTCHIWACPPQRGDGYIFHVHPPSQRVPNKDRLREWYDDWLRSLREEGTVASVTSLFDEYFEVIKLSGAAANITNAGGAATLQGVSGFSTPSASAFLTAPISGNASSATVDISAGGSGTMEGASNLLSSPAAADETGPSALMDEDDARPFEDEEEEPDMHRDVSNLLPPSLSIPLAQVMGSPKAGAAAEDKPSVAAAQADAPSVGTSTRKRRIADAQSLPSSAAATIAAAAAAEQMSLRSPAKRLRRGELSPATTAAPPAASPATANGNKKLQKQLGRSPVRGVSTPEPVKPSAPAASAAAGTGALHHGVAKKGIKRKGMAVKAATPGSLPIKAVGGIGKKAGTKKPGPGVTKIGGVGNTLAGYPDIIRLRADVGVPPYFAGDFWASEMERMIRDLHKRLASRGAKLMHQSQNAQLAEKATAATAPVPATPAPTVSGDSGSASSRVGGVSASAADPKTKPTANASAPNTPSNGNNPSLLGRFLTGITAIFRAGNTAQPKGSAAAKESTAAPASVPADSATSRTEGAANIHEQRPSAACLPAVTPAPQQVQALAPPFPLGPGAPWWAAYLPSSHFFINSTPSMPASTAFLLSAVPACLSPTGTHIRFGEHASIPAWPIAALAHRLRDLRKEFFVVRLAPLAPTASSGRRLAMRSAAAAAKLPSIPEHASTVAESPERSGLPDDADFLSNAMAEEGASDPEIRTPTSVGKGSGLLSAGNSKRRRVTSAPSEATSANQPSSGSSHRRRSAALSPSRGGDSKEQRDEDMQDTDAADDAITITGATADDRDSLDQGPASVSGATISSTAHAGLKRRHPGQQVTFADAPAAAHASGGPSSVVTDREDDEFSLVSSTSASSSVRYARENALATEAADAEADERITCDFFDTRHGFLRMCQGNHYQFDTLRRAKHSSMMILWHLHHPGIPAYAAHCNACEADIGCGVRWHCAVCGDYDLCEQCKGVAAHPHPLEPHQDANVVFALDHELNALPAKAAPKLLQMT